MLTRHDIGRPLMSSFVSPPPVVQPIYKDQIEAYFAHYDIELTWKVINGGEIHKNMEVGENPLLHQPMGSHLAVREADLCPPPPPFSHTQHTPPPSSPLSACPNPQTMLEIVDAMDSFGIVRTEPTLVIGGGLVTDVSGFACASYRRSSNFIRVPTTLIGLIDASVSIKVGLNHRKLKNR